MCCRNLAAGAVLRWFDVTHTCPVNIWWSMRTGRTAALQGEWDRDQGVYGEQYRTLEGLVERVPGEHP